MKKNWLSRMMIIILSSIVVSSCEKSPQVFSVNGFRRLLSDSDAVPGVRLYPVKNIEGIWIGMEHHIGIWPDSLVAAYADGITTYGRKVSFTAELMDITPDTKEASLDTSEYRLLFITIAGEPYIEVLSADKHKSWHDFMLPAKTYLKINKLSRDTIIVQMLRSDATAAWLKVNGYSYFIPTRYRNDELYPLYISEDPPKLGEIMSRINKVRGVYQAPDTIIRKY